MDSISLRLKILYFSASILLFAGCSNNSYQAQLIEADEAELASLDDKSAGRRPPKNTTTTTTMAPVTTTTLPATGSIPTAPTTLEAESMETKSGGQAMPGGWMLWATNLYLENRVNFLTSGSYTFTIYAWSNLAAGIGGEAEIYIDGVASGIRRIFNSTSITQQSVTLNIAAGTRRVAIVFTNDAIIDGQDRNLNVDKIVIAAATVAPPAVVTTTTTTTTTMAPTTTTMAPTTTTTLPVSTVPAGYKLWSDPATWGGTVPVAGQAVTIPAGTNVLLDVNTASLGLLTIKGALVFANKDLNLTASTIYVDGTLQIGSPTAPFVNKATITLTGLDNTGFSRGIMAHGKLLLYGASPNKAWTQLGHHAAAGATSIKLKETVNWKAGDRIVVAPTDFFPGTSDADYASAYLAETPNLSELRTIASASGDTLSLTSSLATFHWGLPQFVTNSGMSLVQDFTFTPPAEPFNRMLDERAEVGNLTRNIVIQSIDDDAWRTNGFGANVMMMTLGSLAQLDGVEFRRVGQAGKLGRYPFHWHMLSYESATGNFLGDATGHYVKNSTISESMNRCLVIHGTNGVLVQNNICFDIKGHAFFLEDAAERRNVIEGNLALRIRLPLAGKALLTNESRIGSTGPSGFWLTNPDNTVRNNAVADAVGPGFWLAYPETPKRLSKLVPIRPTNMKHGIFEYNTSHSNMGSGILLDMVESNDAGDVVVMAYVPTLDEQPNNYQNRLKFELKRINVYKNMVGGYRNRTSIPDYVEWSIADNVGVSVAGATQTGATMVRTLVVGESLNVGRPYPINIWPYAPRAAFASYHSQLDFIHNVAVNFKVTVGALTGVFLADDYYTLAVDKGPVRNVGNRLINSDPGYRVLPVEYRDPPVAGQYWTLSGALWDPHGYYGPKGNYWVYDMPFLTYGANCVYVAPVGQNGMSCDGEYFGVGGLSTDFDSTPFQFQSPIHVTRQTSSGQVIGTWQVGDGLNSSRLGWMRHFAARPGSEYILRFPDRPLAKYIKMDIGNAFRAGDTFMIAVSYIGRDFPSVSISVGGARKDAVLGTSVADVRASTAPKYFVDRANSLIWVKYYGGLPYYRDADPNSDINLYGFHTITVEGR